VLRWLRRSCDIRLVAVQSRRERVEGEMITIVILLAIVFVLINIMAIHSLIVINERDALKAANAELQRKYDELLESVKYLRKDGTK
jgi:hypothetical protein